MDHFYETIDGWFNFQEIYDNALREAVDGSVFVQIGAWYGRSAAYMAVEIANSGKQIDFYCVNTWKGLPDLPWMAEQLATKGGSAFPFFREYMQRGGVWNFIKTIHQPSVEAAKLFGHQSVDFVMVDGAHNYASVRDDVPGLYAQRRRVSRKHRVDWEQYNFGGQQLIHHGSQTRRSDPAISAEVGSNLRWHVDHYRHKWGGAPGQELYSIPYNRKP